MPDTRQRQPIKDKTIALCRVQHSAKALPSALPLCQVKLHSAKQPTPVVIARARDIFLSIKELKFETVPAMHAYRGSHTLGLTTFGYKIVFL